VEDLDDPQVIESNSSPVGELCGNEGDDEEKSPLPPYRLSPCSFSLGGLNFVNSFANRLLSSSATTEGKIDVVLLFVLANA